MGFCVCLIVALLYFVYKKKQNNLQKSKKILRQIKCPICQSDLFKGEDLYSKVFRPMNVPDQLMSISGCPHCFPKCEIGVKRMCPVCHKSIEQNQTLIARLFNKRKGKKHVHIVGCSNCRKKN